MNSDALTLLPADYADPAHADAIRTLLDGYARDPMGGGAGLDPAVLDAVVPGLAAAPGAFTILARLGDAWVGLINCFEGFSTFRAKPLVNVHDVYVAPAARGRGVARALLDAAERSARERGACKMTLEVLSGNRAAQRLYERLGYGGYQLDPATGQALFWQKPLD